MPLSSIVILTSGTALLWSGADACIPIHRLAPPYFTALIIRFCKHCDTAVRSALMAGRFGSMRHSTVMPARLICRALLRLARSLRGGSNIRVVGPALAGDFRDLSRRSRGADAHPRRGDRA